METVRHAITSAQLSIYLRPNDFAEAYTSCSELPHNYNEIFVTMWRAIFRCKVGGRDAPSSKLTVVSIAISVT